MIEQLSLYNIIIAIAGYVYKLTLGWPLISCSSESQLHPLFKNAVHAPHPCFIRNPTGNIIHNFPIVTAMLNIMLLFISNYQS